jgi:Flp pilus assembly secretin CpaC
MLHLPRVMRTVSVANDEVANIQVDAHTPTSVFLYAKKRGATVLYAEDGDGNVIMNRVLQVTHGPVVVKRGAKIPPQNYLVFGPVQAAAPAAP